MQSNILCNNKARLLILGLLCGQWFMAVYWKYFSWLSMQPHAPEDMAYTRSKWQKDDSNHQI